MRKYYNKKNKKNRRRNDVFIFVSVYNTSRHKHTRLVNDNTYSIYPSLRQCRKYSSKFWNTTEHGLEMD